MLLVLVLDADDPDIDGLPDEEGDLIPNAPRMRREETLVSALGLAGITKPAMYVQMGKERKVRKQKRKLCRIPFHKQHTLGHSKVTSLITYLLIHT